MAHPTRLLAALSALVLVSKYASGLKVGAPYGACDTMTPQHGGAGSTPASRNPGYKVEHNMCQGYQSETTYTVRLTAPSPMTFKGFFCRVQEKGTLVQKKAHGRWDSRYLKAYTRLSSCDKPSTGVTHGRTARPWRTMELRWIAPREDVGPVEVTCTVVQSFNVFWVGIRSNPICFNSDGRNSLRCNGLSNRGTAGCRPAGLIGRPSSPPSGQCAAKCPAGPPGTRGSRGPTGIRGPSGARGSPGVPGPQGIRGYAGPTGQQGRAGVGRRGAKGDIGAVGRTGTIGEQGARGNTGRKGDRGVAGPSGPPGPGSGTFFSGSTSARQGPVGPKGSPGPMGPPGPTGPMGMGLQGLSGHPGVDGVVGPKGDRGWHGRTGRDGVPGPQGLPGLPGEPGSVALSSSSNNENSRRMDSMLSNMNSTVSGMQNKLETTHRPFVRTFPYTAMLLQMSRLSREFQKISKEFKRIKKCLQPTCPL